MMIINKKVWNLRSEWNEISANSDTFYISYSHIFQNLWPDNILGNKYNEWKKMNVMKFLKWSWESEYL